MRILFLTQIIPYPPDAGPKVKTWHVIRYLVEQGHQVILASFIRPEEQAHLPEVEKICEQVHTVPIRRSRLADMRYWLRSNFTNRPFLIERDDSRQMRQVVDRLVRTDRIDVIHADQLTMAQFAMPPQSVDGHWPTTVFDAHNAVWTIVARVQENAPWFLKPVLSMEASRIQRYEGKIVRTFDHILAVTEPDRESLLETLPDSKSGSNDHGQITVIPIAVDTHQLQPTEREAGSTNIFTMGTLHYPPNADGIRWFANEIFPLVKEKIPSASLTIVGKNPPADFHQLAAEQPESILVTGYVPDLTPYMEKAALMVVPVRAGGGMRVRILEGFARAMPVVTTTIGLEGIQAQPGTEVIVEDTEGSFADAVVRVIQDRDLQNKLAVNGRQLAETRYDWQVVLSKLGALYEGIR